VREREAEPSVNVIKQLVVSRVEIVRAAPSAGRKQAVSLDHKAMPESEDFNTIDSFLILERDAERVRS
jgi:hypothetical protein